MLGPCFPLHRVLLWSLVALVAAANEDGWIYSNTALVASDGAEGDRFGAALSADANYTAVSATGANGDTGKVYIFQRIVTAAAEGDAEDDISWQESANFQGSDSAAGDLFGAALVCLNNVTVVGAPNHNGGQGAVYVLQKEQQTTKTVRNGTSLSS